jgi:DNA mismatch endonuclease, patch repair protein
MADILTAQERSRLMSQVRDRDTKPELMLRRALWSRGYRYRLACPMPGRPDLTFTRARVVVFVDGCFWHGCPIHASLPKSNAEFWRKKLARNRERDLEVTCELLAQGWTVFRFWEHQVESDLEWVLDTLEQVLGER